MKQYNVKFCGFPHSDSYRSVGHTAWHAGEVREIPEDLKDRLLSQFPGCFVLESGLEVESQEKKSHADSPMGLAAVLSDGVSRFKKLCLDGEYDEILDELLDWEQSNDNRKGIFEAIEKRKEQLEAK